MPPPTKMTPSRFRAFVITMLLLPVQLAVGAAVHAEPLAYVIGSLSDTANGSNLVPSILFLVNLDTAEAVVIGQVTSPSCSVGLPDVCDQLKAIEIDPLTGRFVAISDSEGDAVLKIDPGSAEAFDLVPLLIDGANLGSVIGFGLAVDDAGIYYLSSNSRLGTLIPDTGDATTILSGGSGPNTTSGLADASATDLWALPSIGSGDHNLVLVDKLSPSTTTIIGTLSPQIVINNGGLDLAPDGTLWGVDRDGDLWTVDKSTAVRSIVGQMTVPATSQFVYAAQSIVILPDEILVPGDGNPWLSGMPGGSDDNGNDDAPDQNPQRVLSIDVSGAGSLTFSVTGGTNFAPGCPVPATFPACNPPDGEATVGSHTTSGPGDANGIANLVAPYSALVGVFLDDSAPDGTGPPSGLDFSSGGLGTEFTDLAPQLKQPFFIGDGETSAMQTQIFAVPQNATRLYLGTHDGTGWFNNTGRLDVTVTAIPPVAVPLLQQGVALGMAALIAFAGSWRLRRGY